VEKTRRTQRKSKQPPGGQGGSPALSPHAVEELWDFVRFALGDLRLSSWEENFVNSMKYRAQQEAVRLSPKEQTKYGEVSAKLHYDQQHISLPPIDPDGLVENDDPDGWPLPVRKMDEFAELGDPLGF
jgi:hypothetical protein